MVQVGAQTSGVRRGHIDDGALVHASAQVWDLAHVRSAARVGARTILGRSVYVGPGALIGNDCKIQNGAQIFEPATLEDGIFVGPGAILTNDRFPRAITAGGDIKSASDWEPVGVYVEYGASIGAGAICVAPLRIGKWAMIASGAVLTSDAKAFGCYAGVPARQVGWVGPAGLRLEDRGGSTYRCPSTGSIFSVSPNGDLRQEE